MLELHHYNKARFWYIWPLFFFLFYSVIGDSTKASTMPMNRRSVPSLTPRALSQYEGMGEPGHSKSLPSCTSTTDLRPSLGGAF